MLATIRPVLRPPLSSPKLPLLNSLSQPQIPIHQPPQTPAMQSRSNNPKRPTCPNCSKPTPLCLCVRIRTPSIDNPIHVIILQHCLERNHPINSARIARLGLRNVRVVTVSDVNEQARFEVKRLGCMGGVCGNDGEGWGSGGVGGLGCDDERTTTAPVRFTCHGHGQGRVRCTQSDPSCVGDDERGGRIIGAGRSDERYSLCSDPVLWERLVSAGRRCGVETLERDSLEKSQEDDDEEGRRCDEDVLSMCIEKHGRISSIFHPWLSEQNKHGMEQLLASWLAREALSKGFVVKKFKRQQNSGKMDFCELEEFEISVPPGSAVVFPAPNASGAESISFEVRNLIVLDGTWSKAKRIYNENPWLRLLPCIRLDVDKVSLFNGVRRQPKPGCLSTIESIVYAMESLGSGNLVELHSLLDVFDSMVNDQKRLKDERSRKA